METKNFLSQFLVTFLLSFLLFESSSAADTTTSSTTVYKIYVKTACNSTTYSKLCYDTLKPYASTIKTDQTTLISTALTVTLKSAKKSYSLLKSISKKKSLSKADVAVVKDCLEEVDDSIDEIYQSLESLNSLKGRSNYERELEISNIQTWMSAAITDETTCTDEFEEMNVSDSVKDKMKKSIYNFHSLTTNALALVNKLSYY